jgi:HK97 family phage portal protein
MFKGLSKAILGNQRIDNNILNQMVFQYLNSNDIVWYNNNQATVFVERGYRHNANVYAIVRKIGEKKKVAPLLVYKEKGSKTLTTKYKEYKYSGNSENHTRSIALRSKALEFAEENELAKLLRHPNPNQTWAEFSDDCAGFYDTCGEFFIYGVGPGEDSKNYGKFTELYAMPSHLVTIVTGDYMNPVKAYKLRIGDQIKEIPAASVCHMKSFNPDWNMQGSQLRGQSPLLAGLKYLKRNDIGIFASSKLLENRGAETIVSPNHADPKLWLNPTQVEQTQQTLDEKANGAGNRGRTVVSGMPLQATQLGLSPQALQIIESMNDDVTTLCSLWGLDPILLGRGTGTYANQEQARKSLVTDIVIPYLNNFEQKLMQWLVPAYSKADGVQYILDFDTSVYPELQSDLKLIKEVYLDSQILSTDEKRLMVNFDELGTDEAKVILVDAGKIPLADAAMSMPDDGELKDAFGDYR